jgi:transcription antitermination factor NusG
MASDGTRSGEACPRWYALRVRGGHERRVERFLKDAGFETFVPSYSTPSQWSDRVQNIERPLFPGYVFAELALANGQAIPQLVTVLRIPSVYQILPTNLAPEAIPDAEIAAVRAALAAKVPLFACDFEPGQRVTVERGPLKWTEGVVSRRNGVTRLVISMTLLARSVFVHLDAADVAPETAKRTNETHNSGN